MSQAGIIDPSSVEGCVAMARSFATSAEKNFVRDGELLPVAFIIVTKNPETGETIPPTPAVVTPPQCGLAGLNSQEDKDLFGSVIRGVVRQGDGIAVILLMESWSVADDKVDEGMKWAREKGSLEHFPGRQEQITMIMEHRLLGSKGKFWVAPIIREDGKKPRLDLWKETPGVQAQGRFAGFFSDLS